MLALSGIRRVLVGSDYRVSLLSNFAVLNLPVSCAYLSGLKLFFLTRFHVPPSKKMLRGLDAVCLALGSISLHFLFHPREASRGVHAAIADAIRDILVVAHNSVT